jgi:hypothetical protein
MMEKRKHRMLFSPKVHEQSGPKGPSKELIAAVVETKQRNPGWGCPRIAQQINLAFGIDIDKDVVRRILSIHYRPGSASGPSWLTFLGHMKDSLWSCDLFRCEIGNVKNPLDFSCDGSAYGANHWVWGPPGSRGRYSAVPDV